jgi:hypothetical protein
MATGKKRVNSKAKGSEYERKIARLLGKWFGEEFHRVPQSGGLRWGTDSRVAGDIVTHPESKYPFTTECKKREKWDLEQVLKGTGDVEDWWQQSVNDSERVHLKPILIFSKNFAPDYLMIRVDDFMKVVPEKVPFNYFLVRVVGKELRIVCNLEDFLGHVSKETVISELSV